MVRCRVREGVLYAGCSAGAIVTGRSIETAFWKGWDDPAAVDADWSAPGAVDGLGFVGCSFFPHFDEQWAALAESRRPELGHALTCIDESSAYVCGDDTAGAVYPGDADGTAATPGYLFPSQEGSVAPTKLKGGFSAAGGPGGVGLKANARFAGGWGLNVPQAVPTALRTTLRNKASRAPLSLSDLMGADYYLARG